MKRRRCRGERGSGTVLTAGLMGLVLALAGAATVIAGYLVAAHRAKAAADLGALSGAAAVRSGLDPCLAAIRAADRQRAEVRDCRRVGDQIDFVVIVTAQVSVGVRVPGLPRTLAAVGHAGPTRSGP